MSSVVPDETLPNTMGAATTARGPTLHSLPPEVIERALISSDPRDVARYAQTCRFARDLVYEPKDAFLWRELFLGGPFDDPREAVPIPPKRYNPVPSPIAKEDRSEDPLRISSGPCWSLELQRRVRAEAIAAASERTGADELYRAFEAFLTAIDTAIPVAEGETSAGTNVDSSVKPGITSRSENIRWLNRVLSDTDFNVLDRTITSAHSITNPPLPSPFESIDPRRREILPMRDVGTFLETDNIVAVEAHQLRHKLRAYTWPSRDKFADETRMATLRNASRCFVYNMRKYDARTLWGPYRVVNTDGATLALPEPMPVLMDESDSEPDSYEDEEGDGENGGDEALWGVGWGHDGTPGRTTGGGSTAHARRKRSKQTLLVNWEHIEHIVNVVRLKLRDISHPALGFDEKPLFTLDGLRAYSAVGSFERDPRDWAGVTGKWRRFVCFMDYRDLYMFNYSHLPPGPHHPEFFEAVSFDEAMRPVELHLSLISKEEYFSNPSRIPHALPNPLPASDVSDPAFPTLYFDGHSRGPPSSVASIRGKVSTLADGAIRWQFVTTYDGRMQWSAEGVQLGHACSAAGIAGIWTGAHHERDDPAGPFWMVKAEDDLPDGILNTLH
ncbi:hypothetical protein C8Q78DRAFT_1060772 [Trametes maxima]|nr:hypothetical protein C8Q78DRAFT_1060772 [Trametes maxima]